MRIYHRWLMSDFGQELLESLESNADDWTIPEPDWYNIRLCNPQKGIKLRLGYHSCVTVNNTALEGWDDFFLKKRITAMAEQARRDTKNAELNVVRKQLNSKQ